MGDGFILRIDLNLSGERVPLPESPTGQVLFELSFQEVEHLQWMVLAPYSAIVTLEQGDGEYVRLPWKPRGP